MYDGTEDPARIAPTPAPTMDIDEAWDRLGAGTPRPVNVEGKAGPVFDLGRSLDAFRNPIWPAGDLLPPCRRGSPRADFASRRARSPNQFQLQHLGDGEYQHAQPPDGEVVSANGNKPSTHHDPQEKPEPRNLGYEHCRKPQRREAG
jgi:hypothetical protein